MSHFTVAVFTDPKHDGDSVDSLLGPYNENIEVERYLYKTKAELIADERKRIAYHKERYDQYLADPEKYVQENFVGQTDNYQFKWLTTEFPPQMSWTDEECYQHAIEHVSPEKIDPETGDMWSTYNPDSKWDWWALGGRWGCTLLVKDEDGEYVHADEGFVRDVDFEGMCKELAEDLTPYEDYMKGDQIFKKEYLESLYPDEKTYIQKNTEFSTFAVVTPDGKWHECGEMGWFGCSSETAEENTAWHNNYYDKFIKPAIENDWYVTIVDCHI